LIAQPASYKLVPGLREEDEQWAFDRREGEEACLKRWSDRSFNVDVSEVSKLMGYIMLKVVLLQHGYAHFNEVLLHGQGNSPLLTGAILGAADRPLLMQNAAISKRKSRSKGQVVVEVVTDSSGSAFE
jgi:hypothetical protein